MRRHGSTVLFVLVVVGFFALVAAEDYAWTSAAAYCQVRLAELILVVVLIGGFNLFMGTLMFIDWCHLKIARFRRNRRR